MVNKKILLIAVLLAFVTTFVAYYYLKTEIGKVKYEEELLSVIVAKTKIAPRTAIDETMIEETKIPRSFILPNAAINKEDVVGKICLIPIIAGEQIILTDERIAIRDTSLGLAFIIPEGKRAISIRVSEKESVAGFIKTGDKIDIICSFDRDECEGGQKTVSILQNKKILAIGQETTSTKRKGQKGKTLLVTFALTLAEAETLILASEKGRINFALRSFADVEETVIDRGLSEHAFKQKYKDYVSTKKRNTTFGIRIIRGISEGTEGTFPAPSAK